MIAIDQRDPILPAQGPRIGDKVRFIPSCNYDNSAGFGGILMTPVTGTIVQIHADHRWYRVEYIMGDNPGCIGYECFKY